MPTTRCRVSIASAGLVALLSLSSCAVSEPGSSLASTPMPQQSRVTQTPSSPPTTATTRPSSGEPTASAPSVPARVAQKIVLDVPYVSQLTPVKARTGCEFASLLMVLRYQGWEKGDLNAVLPHVIYHDSDPEQGFVGSVYKWIDGKPEVIHPGPLAKMTSRWGASHELREKTVDGLVSELRDGNPVVVWVTMAFELPEYKPYQLNGTTIQQLWNTHTVVLGGYNPASDEFLIFDPFDESPNQRGQKYWISGQLFRRSWEPRRLGFALGN